MALEDLLRAPVGEKGGIKEMKTGDMSEKESILVWGRDRLKHTNQCRAFPNMSVLIGGIKNLNTYIN